LTGQELPVWGNPVSFASTSRPAAQIRVVSGSKGLWAVVGFPEANVRNEEERALAETRRFAPFFEKPRESVIQTARCQEFLQLHAAALAHPAAPR
jgi:hypothetical protein